MARGPRPPKSGIIACAWTTEPTELHAGGISGQQQGSTGQQWLQGILSGSVDPVWMRDIVPGPRGGGGGPMGARSAPFCRHWSLVLRANENLDSPRVKTVHPDAQFWCGLSVCAALLSVFAAAGEGWRVRARCAAEAVSPPLLSCIGAQMAVTTSRRGLRLDRRDPYAAWRIQPIRSMCQASPVRDARLYNGQTVPDARPVTLREH